MDRQAKEYGIRPDEQQCPVQALFHVYEDDIFLGKRSFADGSLSIGRSRKADILLNHQCVEEIHAVVTLDGNRLILNNNFPSDGLKVNGLSVESVPLKTRDIINIGPYDIHVEIEAAATVPAAEEPAAAPLEEKIEKRKGKAAAKQAASPPQADCSLVLVDRYLSVEARFQAARKLSTLYKNDYKTWLPLLSRERFVIKKNLALSTAKRLRKKFQAAGVCCMIEKDGEPYDARPSTEPESLDFSDILTPKVTLDATAKVAPEAASDATRHGDVGQTRELKAEVTGDEENRGTNTEPAPEPETSWKPAVRTPLYQFNTEEELDDDDDEEEALWVAPFSLQDRLKKSVQPAKLPKHLPKQLSILKTIGPAVADAMHLTSGKSFRIPAERGTQLFARQTAKGLGYVFFTKSMDGYIRYADQTAVNLDQYKTDAHLHKRRKQIYRFTVPDDAVVVIKDGDIKYTLNHCALPALADVKEGMLPKSLTWRHWAASFCFHLLLILAAGILYYFQATAPLKEEPRFVKIDPALLKQLEMKKVDIEKPKPKEIPPPPKPEPQKLAEKVKPVKQKVKPKPQPKATAARKTSRKVARAAAPSRHPNAGGGFGKGNTTNRNINQTGLLSLLGNSKIAGPSEAIASVTNLDAVPSPGATKKNFTVGGIKGSLGTGKIAVTNDAIIQTKGSTQVLRSAGASGPGLVAALEKGKTGKKQVQAMVTAKMTRTVKIEGGMSREAVKRVIDQHLDEITMCYETALLENPSISGRVVFEWKILMSGRVGEIKIVASNINSNEIHECIKSAIKRWPFPKPTGSEVVVSYPFVFDLVAF